jgi:hypothetical protein
MRQHGNVTAGFLMGMALLGGAPGEATDATAAQAKNEMVVFGGASVLDAKRSQDATIGMPGWTGDPWPGDPWPDFPDVQVRTETSLGGSALFGARYSRYVKGRLAVEADLAVAPTHELEAGGELCQEGGCFGRGMRGDRMRGSRNLTAWHYGAGLAYDITGGDVRPVVIFGAGGVSYDGAGEASTDFVLRFGAGLKVLFGRVGARVDVVDHLVTEHFLSGDAEHDIHATAGFLVRF